MYKLAQVPDGLQAIMALYGVPGRMENGRYVADRAWVAENLARFYLSFPLRQSWPPYSELRSFYAHKLVGHVMIDALEEIHDFYGLSFMRRHGLDYWGGVYNPRLKTGGSEPSAHAWAVAIDYCPELGQRGDPPRMPWPIVDAFTKRGFEWGGLWETPDGMHAQAARGY